MKKKLIAILAIAGAVLTAVLLILKEVLKGRVTYNHLEDLKTGIRDEKKKNVDIIRDSTKAVKLQDKIIKEKAKQIKEMNMNEQLDYAKKLGLVK